MRLGVRDAGALANRIRLAGPAFVCAGPVRVVRRRRQGPPAGVLRKRDAPRGGAVLLEHDRRPPSAHGRGRLGAAGRWARPHEHSRRDPGPNYVESIRGACPTPWRCEAGPLSRSTGTKLGPSNPRRHTAGRFGSLRAQACAPTEAQRSPDRIRHFVFFPVSRAISRVAHGLQDEGGRLDRLQKTPAN